MLGSARVAGYRSSPRAGRLLFHAQLKLYLGFVAVAELVS